MLQLFQSIFRSGRGDSSPHPAVLITRATERAVDGTDPRVRALSGYQKSLRASVIHAVNHVVALVDGLPPALELNPLSYGTDPEITTYFASVEHVREVLECDPTLIQWRRSAAGASAGEVNMLLLMTMEERNVLGIALEGDALRHGVPQTTVSFSKHQLVDPHATGDEMRSLLKRRAFDQLLMLALGRLATATAERDELQREHALLRRKLTALAAGNWDFSKPGCDGPCDPEVLNRQLDDIDAQLRSLGSGTSLLSTNLGIVADVLMKAEQNFWCAHGSVCVDRLGVKQADAGEHAPSIDLTVLRNAAGQSLVARLVRVDRAALPAQRDLLREAERYLG